MRSIPARLARLGAAALSVVAATGIAFAGQPAVAAPSNAVHAPAHDSASAATGIPVAAPEAKLLPTTIFGTDNRTRVTPTTGTNYKAAVVYFESYTPDGTFNPCSGWMVSPSLVVTAGHCIYNRISESGIGWNTNYTVYPGSDGAASPYGSCGVVSGGAGTVNGWIVSGTREYDYGSLKLDCTIGSQTGTFGMQWQSGSYGSLSTKAVGYPADKTAYTQWTDNDPLIASLNQQITFKTDVFHQQSGGPVWGSTVSGCASPCAIGLITYDEYGSYVGNRGTRITEDVFNNIQAWK